MQRLKKVAKSIDVKYNDIKAEVIIADIREHDIDFDNIEIKFDGTFKRNYTKDVDDLRVDMVNKTISMHVARNSLYDLLPEGLFHPVTRYNGLDHKELKSEFKKQKLEEEKSRKFFKPYDQEFLFRRTQLELYVRKLFEDPLPVLEDIFPDTANIPERFFRQLLRFLPFTGYFKGDPEMTARCLSEIVGEDVRTVSYYDTRFSKWPDSNDGQSLGKTILGENFICGNGLSEQVLVWRFIIEVKDDKRLEELVGADKGYVFRKLIDYFCAYFVPFEIVVETRIVCSGQRPLTLAGDSENPETDKEQQAVSVFLGYNTSL